VRRAALVLVLAFLLLFTVFGVFFNVALVRGSEEIIYIRADGSVEGTGKIVTADYVTYNFTDNINGSITVERDNIVIDGAGYTLRGEGDRDGTGMNLTGITNVTIRNTQIVNFQVGVWLRAYSSNNTVTENTFVDNSFGVEIDVSYYNTISENILTDNGNGIWLDTAWDYDGGSNYNTIIGNNITTCFWDAIGLANESSNNTIIGNNVIDNQYGITIYGPSNNNIIGGNIIDMIEGGWGIYLDYQCEQTIISGNNIKNTYYGIYLSRVSYNNFSGNNVENSDYGVYLYQASDNRFWHNNFIDNTQQVDFEGDSYANIWDDGYPSGGNFWSDYSGSDANGDGIGDSSYVIDSNNIDYYPLMMGYGSFAEKSFNVTVGETDYVVTTVSNSTVSDFSFNLTSKQISFSVSGPSGTTGFCNITVPAELMWGDFSLYLDDVALVEDVDYVESFNGTHYLFSVTYVHSSHVIDLVSTDVVPDFAGWLFLPFFMSATLLGFALRKRLKKQLKLA
jgi:parallel beta-helix repeat protein